MGNDIVQPVALLECRACQCLRRVRAIRSSADHVAQAAANQERQGAGRESLQARRTKGPVAAGGSRKPYRLAGKGGVLDAADEIERHRLLEHFFEKKSAGLAAAFQIIVQCAGMRIVDEQGFDILALRIRHLAIDKRGKTTFNRRWLLICHSHALFSAKPGGWEASANRAAQRRDETSSGVTPRIDAASE
ncbi:hypothetical protein D3C73_1149760 [compost metagenome]